MGKVTRLYLIENIKICVVGWRLDRQQVEDGMEDVMLLQHRRQVALVRSETL